MQAIPGSLTALAVKNNQEAGMDTGNHAAIFSNGQTSDLGSLGGQSVSTALNPAGHAVGLSSSHAFLFNGTMADLGLRDNWTSASAVGINDADVVIGNGLSPAGSVRVKPAAFGAWSLVRDSSSGVSHPFTWTQAFGLVDLNTVIPSNSG